MSSFATHAPSSAEGPPGSHVSRNSPETIRIRNCHDFHAIVEDGDNLTVRDCRDFEVKIESGATVTLHSCSDFQIVHGGDDDDFTDTSFSGDTALDHLEEDVDQAVSNNANRSTGAVNEASYNSDSALSDSTTALTPTSSDAPIPEANGANDHIPSDSQQDNRQTTAALPIANSDLSQSHQEPAINAAATATQPIPIPVRTNVNPFLARLASLSVSSHSSSNDDDEDDSNFTPPHTTQANPSPTTDDLPTYDQATQIPSPQTSSAATTGTPLDAAALEDLERLYRLNEAVLSPVTTQAPNLPYFPVRGAGVSRGARGLGYSGRARGRWPGATRGFAERRGAISEQGGREPNA